MTDKTPTLVEELQSLFNGGAVRDYGAAPVIEAATRHEQAWQAKLAEVEAERDEARDGGARLHSRMVALEATLTAERERADRAESHANAAETQAGIDRVLRRAAEAENARLLERLRAIDPLVLIEGSEDGFHHYRCVACNRGSRPDHADARHFTSCIFAPTAPTGETR
jgi:hypothetical protein